jgi:hypothetical protein
MSFSNFCDLCVKQPLSPSNLTYLARLPRSYAGAKPENLLHAQRGTVTTQGAAKIMGYPWLSFVDSMPSAIVSSAGRKVWVVRDAIGIYHKACIWQLSTDVNQKNP